MNYQSSFSSFLKIHQQNALHAGSFICRQKFILVKIHPMSLVDNSGSIRNLVLGKFFDFPFRCQKTQVSNNKSIFCVGYVEGPLEILILQQINTEPDGNLEFCLFELRNQKRVLIILPRNVFSFKIGGTSLYKNRQYKNQEVVMRLNLYGILQHFPRYTKPENTICE